MKKFKKLMVDIQEAGSYTEGGSVFNGFSDPQPRSALSDTGLHYAYKNPEQLARLNAFVNSFLGGSYMDPKEPLKELSGRIGQLGLSMRIGNDVVLKAGPNYIPLQVFGEKFGVTPTTDLSQGFDTGKDYPDMVLCFDLTQTKQGYVFADAHVKSQLCTDCPQEVGQEKDNTTVVAPAQQNEEYDLTEEKDHKDPARVVELFLQKDDDGSKRILQPIYSTLKSMKKKNKYSTESAKRKFMYAIGAGLRSLTNSGRNITLSSEEKNRVATRLVTNFEKHIKTLQD